MDTAILMVAARTPQVQLSTTTSAILPAVTTSSAAMPICKIQAVGLVVFKAARAVASADRVAVNAGPAEFAVLADIPGPQATQVRIDQTAYRLTCLK